GTQRRFMPAEDTRRPSRCRKSGRVEQPAPEDSSRVGGPVPDSNWHAPFRDPRVAAGDGYAARNNTDSRSRPGRYAYGWLNASSAFSGRTCSSNSTRSATSTRRSSTELSSSRQSRVTSMKLFARCAISRYRAVFAGFALVPTTSLLCPPHSVLCGHVLLGTTGG